MPGFYVASKQQQGPVGVPELAALLARGKAAGGIGGETHVWCGAMVEWKRLKEVPSLLQVLQQPPVSAPQSSQAAPSASTAAAQAAPASRPVQDRAGAEAAPPQARRAVAGRSSAQSKHSGIRNWLTGWLPSRAAPRDLVKRVILPNEPLRPEMGQMAAAPPSPHAIFGNELRVILARPDTADGIPRVLAVLMDRLRAEDSAGLRNEGIFRNVRGGWTWPWGGHQPCVTPAVGGPGRGWTAAMSGVSARSLTRDPHLRPSREWRLSPAVRRRARRRDGDEGAS